MPRIPIELASPPRVSSPEMRVNLPGVPQLPRQSLAVAGQVGEVTKSFGDALTEVAVRVGEGIVRAEGEREFTRVFVDYLGRQEQVRQRVAARTTTEDESQRLPVSDVPQTFATEARTELDAAARDVRNPYARSRLLQEGSRNIVLASADIRRDATRRLAGEAEEGLRVLMDQARIARATGASNAEALEQQVQQTLARLRPIMDPNRMGTLVREYREGGAQDVILGAAQSNPTGVMGQIMRGRFADPRVQAAWDSMTPTARDRLTTRVRDDARYVLELGRAGEAAQNRRLARDGAAAQADFEDAMRNNDTEAAGRALARIRSSQNPEAYRRAADQFYGTPANPRAASESAFLESRILDLRNPLTRQELEGLRSERRINAEQYTSALARIDARQSSAVQQAEAFVQRELGVPSPLTPESQLSQVQRQARINANTIINDMVRARVENPDLNPLNFVQERVQQLVPPGQTVERDRAVQQLQRLPPELQSREGVENLAQQLSNYQAFLNLNPFQRALGTRPPQPVVTVQGQRIVVTADQIRTWRQLHERAGTPLSTGGQQQ